MASNELNAKRAQAAYLTKRANHKISRLRRSADVEVAGTEYDPRKSRKVLSHYTQKQLDAYIGRVSRFVDRSTQFVGDLQHRPIPSSEWKEYKTAETAHREHMASRFSQIKNYRLPGIDGRPGAETIEQRRAKMVSDRRLAGNPTVYDPFDPPVRQPRNVKDRKALKALLRAEKKKNMPGWDNQQLKRQLKEFNQIITVVGDKTLAAKVMALSSHQFFVLWNGTGFANALGIEYEQKMLMVRGRNQPYDEKLVQDAYQDAHRYADWAGEIPRYGDDPWIKKYRKGQLKEHMEARGYRAVGNEFFKITWDEGPNKR